MEYIVTFKTGTSYKGYYVLVKAKNIELAKKYVDENYKDTFEAIYPIKVYKRYQDEYGSISSLFNEIKLKEVKVK